MGEDKVWGIMPSPTHYLTRNAGIVAVHAAGVGVRDIGHHIGLESTTVATGRDRSSPGWSSPSNPRSTSPRSRSRS